MCVAELEHTADNFGENLSWTDEKKPLPHLTWETPARLTLRWYELRTNVAWNILLFAKYMKTVNKKVVLLFGDFFRAAAWPRYFLCSRFQFSARKKEKEKKEPNGNGYCWSSFLFYSVRRNQQMLHKINSFLFFFGWVPRIGQGTEISNIMFTEKSKTSVPGLDQSFTVTLNNSLAHDSFNTTCQRS